MKYDVSKMFTRAVEKPTTTIQFDSVSMSKDGAFTMHIVYIKQHMRITIIRSKYDDKYCV